MNAEAALAIEVKDNAPIAQDYLEHMQQQHTETPVAVVAPINEVVAEAVEKPTAEDLKTVLQWEDSPIFGMSAANLLNGCILHGGDVNVFIPGFIIEDGMFRNISFLKPMGKRGRPAGAKNKVTKIKKLKKLKKTAKAPKAGKQKIKKPVKKAAGKRGRPAGSKNKAQGRGRPKGSKNKAK